MGITESLLFEIVRAFAFSVTAAVLFGIVLRFFRHLSPNFHRATWFAVLLLGLCIFRFSIHVPVLEPILPEPVSTVPVSEGAVAAPGFPVPILTETMPELTGPPLIVLEEPTVALTTSPSLALPSATTMILITWSIGFVILLVRRLFHFLRLALKLRGLRQNLVPDEDILWSKLLARFGVKARKIPILWTDNAGPALVRNIGGYRLLIPKNLWEEIPDRQKIGVLRHELCHYLHGDVWTEEFVRFLTMLQWFNPAAWFALHKFCEATEWRCDDFSYGEQEDGPKDLIETLLSVHQSTESLGLYLSSFARLNVIRRINRLLDTPEPKGNTMTKKIVLLTLITAFFAGNLLQVHLVARQPETAPVAKETDPPSETSPQVIVLSEEPKEKTTTVRGRVFLPDGTPAKNAYIGLEYQNLTKNSSIITGTSANENGEYSCKMPVGVRMLGLVKNQKNEGSEWLEGGLASPILSSYAVENPKAGQYDIHLKKGIPVGGTLRYEDGTPAVGKTILVSMYGFDGQEFTLPEKDELGRDNFFRPYLYQHVYSDKDGRYMLWLLPGQKYEIIQEDLSDDKRQVSLTLTEDEKERSVDFILAQPTELRFVLPDGTPTTEVEIHICSRMREHENRNITKLKPEADGRFRAVLSPVADLISVRTPDGRFGNNVLIQGEERLKPIAVTLLPVATVAVRLRDETTDRPVRGKRLAYYPFKRIHANLLLMNGEMLEQVETDGDGVATLTRIYAGTDYELYDGYTEDGDSEIRVDIPPAKAGETVDLGTVKVKDNLVPQADDPTPATKEATLLENSTAFMFDIFVAETDKTDSSADVIKAVSEKIGSAPEKAYSHETVSAIFKEFDKDGKLSVLSRPRIVTLSDEKAMAMIGNDYRPQLRVNILPRQQKKGKPVLVEIELERRILEENNSSTVVQWKTLGEMTFDKPLLVGGTLGPKEFVLFVTMMEAVPNPDVIDAIDPETGKLVTFTVPDGSPQDMLDYIDKNFGRGIGITQTASGYDFLYRQMSTIYRAAEKGLAGNPTKPQRIKLLEHKRWAFTDLALQRPENFPKYDAFVAEIETEAKLDSDYKKLATDSRGRYYATWMNQFYRRPEKLDKKDFLDHRARILAFIVLNGDFQQLLGLDLVTTALKIADRENDRTIAIETARQVEAVLKSSLKEFNRNLAYRPEAILNKHWLKEDGLKFRGVDSDGNEFDIASMRGKTVLIVLWNNSQVPFKNGKTNLELILPKLREFHEKYADKGLEIVDVCIAKMGDDLWKSRLAEFPWKRHFHEEKCVAAGFPSLRKSYDLFGNHQFLIGSDGKVLVSWMSDGFNDDLLKKKGLSWKNWSDSYYTLDVEEELKERFSER